jgi:hypothetical protein
MHYHINVFFSYLSKEVHHFEEIPLFDSSLCLESQVQFNS